MNCIKCEINKPKDYSFTLLAKEVSSTCRGQPRKMADLQKKSRLNRTNVMLPSVFTKALKIYGNLNQQQRNEMKQKFKKYKKNI